MVFFKTFAIVFGLLVDIVYTGTLGVYMFAYGLALFIIAFLREVLATQSLTFSNPFNEAQKLTINLLTTQFSI